MKMIEITKATELVAEYAHDLDKAPIVFSKRGKPVAALVSLKNIDAETLRLSTNPRFIALIEKSRAQLRTEGGISSAVVRRKLKLKPAKSGK